MLDKIKQWLAFDAEAYEAPEGIPSPDQERELVLYQYAACGYCMRVRRVIDRTGVDVALENSRQPDARERLLAATGRTQVPCLFIDGVPMLESRDISHWLLAYAERAAS